jgi:hypothetical protein
VDPDLRRDRLPFSATLQDVHWRGSAPLIANRQPIFSMDIQKYQQTNRAVQNRNEYYTH